jgi:hypothetical protein
MREQDPDPPAEELSDEMFTALAEELFLMLDAAEGSAES